MRKHCSVTEVEGTDTKAVGARLSHTSIVCLRDIEHGCANMTISKLLCIAEAFDLSLVKLNFLTMPEDELMEAVRNARDKAGIR